MINIILGFIFPALWIFYFLKKDKNPEPIGWLLLAFILGIVSAALSYFVENFVFSENYFNLGTFPTFYLLSAFIEEFFKFFVIWVFIFPRKVFDEPVDAMIYMSVSAFGFASIENIFYLFSVEKAQFLILLIRFLGANFLHVLASGLIGYGYGYFKLTRRFLPLLFSFCAAIILHFLYNFAIIKIEAFGLALVLPILWSVFLIVLSELDYLVLRNERRTKT